MSWLSNLFSAQLSDPIKAIGDALDKNITTDEERMNAQAALDKIRQAPQVLTLEINRMMTEHKSAFVAGARPMVIYICSAGFFYASFLAPFLHQVFNFPPLQIDMRTNMELLYAILGLGGMRTYEKLKGVAS